MRHLLAAVLLATLAIGCKGDPEKCDKACRNYAELIFWEKANAEIDAAPADKRDELRKTKLAEFTKNLELGINTCTSKCLSANNDDDTKCLLAAKTAQQAKDCVTD
ncbi:MAG TPA: hypothetical protein VMZ53_30745 [Kofleriaceae bacterium]|nr:hypothetical protein [Kofleriaceae bacterium]